MNSATIFMLCLVPIFCIVLLLCVRCVILLKRMEKILLDTAKETLSKEDFEELLKIINKY